MKYVVCVCEGLSDYPLENLNKMTPLEFARTPNLNKLAKMGRCGLARLTPRAMEAGYDLAKLPILGYNPKKVYSPIGPVELAGHGIALRDGQIAFRCNFINISDGIIIDYNAGYISSVEAEQLISALNDGIGIDGVRFYSGNGYRNIVVIDDNCIDFKKALKIKTAVPHEIEGESVEGNLPEGPGSLFLRELTVRASLILENHEINQIRLDLNEPAANYIWIWGGGIQPSLPSFYERFNLRGVVVSRVDYLRGMAKLAGLDVAGITRHNHYFDVDCMARTRIALESLRDYDLVIINIESCDEVGYIGSLKDKIRLIEKFDEDVVGYVLKNISDIDPVWRLLVMSGSCAPVVLRKYMPEPVPFAVMGYGVKPDNVSSFSEKSVKRGGYKVKEGHNLIPILLYS